MWSNERQTATLEKIDHVFVWNEWDDAYPSCFLSALGTAVSDHCSLMLDLNVDISTRKIFRFEEFWCKAEGFMDVVQMAWTSTPTASNVYLTLHNKLRATTVILQGWSDRWIGNVKLQIAIAMEVIKQLDIAMESRELSNMERDLRRCLKKKLLGLCSLERAIMRQQYWLLQLQEGDGNTRLFHNQASHRHRKNIIRAVRHNGQLYSGQDEVASTVDAYYGATFDTLTPREHTIHLAALDLPNLNLSHLEQLFTVDEVESAIKAMPPDKASGPDGFACRFYATCWSIIKDDFMAVMC